MSCLVGLVWFVRYWPTAKQESAKTERGVACGGSKQFDGHLRASCNKKHPPHAVPALWSLLHKCACYTP
eukprot:NODE_2353_length_364_cov_69.793249_g2343_i0.p2 GENE.NODE_2353_length_364_cov_69.793249_g2343_i0~~NODE_2353_length_364_cov_69.793249_g2343_i0.p2  ORF type:complete len:69 (+),score=8.36 NODE_2353_length_364_cov_69.793249_g2343_i0:45-251(+)